MAAIVIDNGSGFIKSGLAGYKAPTTIFRSMVGEAACAPLCNDQPINHQCSSHTTSYMGDSALDHLEGVSVRFPIRYGVVNDWERMEKLWSYTMQQQLGVDPR